MKTGRPKAELVLTGEEHETLTRWARRPKSSRQPALRAKIVLACAGGLDNGRAAGELGVCAAAVGKWRQRFVDRRLEGLADEPRPGAPRRISDADVERVATRTLESKPEDATHWSTRSMAEAAGLSQTAVSRIWRAFGLKPHRTGTLKLSADPFFVEKVRDVVGLYMSPPDRAVVLCVDEKSQVQAVDRTQPLPPLEPGSPGRHTRDHVRHGTTSLFAALDVKTGEVIGKCLRRHRHQEFLRSLDDVDAQGPRQPGMTIHLVLDNYATTTRRARRRP